VNEARYRKFLLAEAAKLGSGLLAWRAWEGAPS